MRRRRWLDAALVGGVVIGEAAALFIGGPPHAAFEPAMGVAQALVGAAGVLVAAPGAARWRAVVTAGGIAAAVVLVEAGTGLVTRLVWG